MKFEDFFITILISTSIVILIIGGFVLYPKISGIFFYLVGSLFVYFLSLFFVKSMGEKE
jgi:uncharacterized membrane protein